MTESSPHAHPQPAQARRGPPRRRSGPPPACPILGVDVRVLGDDDVEVPWDGATVGEVCARSNHVMIGYLDAPEATAEVLRDGWLRTGDLAVVDADGYLTIVDRAKDLIVSGGENIASVEVEQALERAPRGARGRPWSACPTSAGARCRAPSSSLVPGASADEAELIAWVRERLARFKAPKSVVILDELPKGGTGKIQKQALRDLA